MIKKLILIILVFISLSAVGQDKKFEKWNENELAQYSKLMELSKYVHNKKKTDISKDTLFEKYVYFDNVLSDTEPERKERRLEAFDTIFYYFRSAVDCIGLENFDAKPIRFYKDHKIYEPFNEEKAKLKSINGEKMYAKDENVFAYYRKDDPQNPIGTLLFEPKSDKLAAWILLDQGGYRYFLTFNLL